jgi:hypothetical protein
MKKPKKRDALKAACLQAAATVWASGKLHAHHEGQTPQEHANQVADFALLLYRAWIEKESASREAELPSLKKVSEELEKRAAADRDSTAPSAGKAP